MIAGARGFPKKWSYFLYALASGAPKGSLFSDGKSGPLQFVDLVGKRASGFQPTAEVSSLNLPTMKRSRWKRPHAVARDFLSALWNHGSSHFPTAFQHCHDYRFDQLCSRISTPQGL